MSPPTPAAVPFADPAGTWNRRFAGDAYVYGTEANIWLREHAHIWQPGQRVLSVADGEGRNSVWLAERGLQVDAFDIAEVGVAEVRATTLIPAWGIRYHPSRE